MVGKLTRPPLPVDAPTWMLIFNEIGVLVCVQTVYNSAFNKSLVMSRVIRNLSYLKAGISKVRNGPQRKMLRGAGTVRSSELKI